MNTLFRDGVIQRYVFEFDGLVLLIITCVFSEMSVISLWLAMLMSAISAALSARRSFRGGVFGILLLLLFTLIKALYDPTMTFSEKLIAIASFEQGQRVLFCIFIHITASIIIAIARHFKTSRQTIMRVRDQE